MTLTLTGVDCFCFQAQEELPTLVCALQVSVIELFRNDLSGTLPSSWSNLSQVQVDMSHYVYSNVLCMCAACKCNTVHSHEAIGSHACGAPSEVEANQCTQRLDYYVGDNARPSLTLSL